MNAIALRKLTTQENDFVVIQFFVVEVDVSLARVSCCSSSILFYFLLYTFLFLFLIYLFFAQYLATTIDNVSGPMKCHPSWSKMPSGMISLQMTCKPYIIAKKIGLK